jgi:hypothetical protein
MKFNLRVASLLVIIGIFGFSTTVLAQKNISKKTKPGASSTKPETTSTRPPSTGTGNASTRPASTGSVSDGNKLYRASRILGLAVNFPAGTVEDSGSNLARTKGFIKEAFEKSVALSNKYNAQYPSGMQAYNPPSPQDMNGVKSNLQQALDYLNAVDFETEQNHRASTIDFTKRAMRQIDAYLIDPPASKKTRPAKKNPKGTDVANPNGTSQSDTGQQRMIKSDTSLKTTPAGMKNGGEIDPCETQSSNSSSNKTAKAKGKNQTTPANGVTSPAGTWECAKANEKSTQPNNSSDTTNSATGTTSAKMTNTKPKASSKSSKPTNNLDPLDDPWGKTPKKKVKN